MITVPLSLLLERGLTIETDEAVAIVQSLASSTGVPLLDNVEISSAGAARCRSARGQPTVAALASLLHRLLPRTGVPAALRYTVARGLGAVDAPAFSSVQDFSQALSRFERRDRAVIIQGLLSRGRPARPIASPPRPAARPVRRSRLRPALYAAAAVLIFGVAGFDVQMVRLDRLASAPGSARAAVLPPSISADASVLPFGRAVALPLSTDLSAAPASPLVPREAARRNAAAMSRQPVRVLPAAETPAFSPAFASGGTALFFQTGGTHERSSAIEVARWRGDPADGLRIMNVVSDGARNYHAQPSPDGRRIAFDSDRDGVRGVYVADRDGTHVRRISGDGRLIAFDSDRDGVRGVYVADRDGTHVRRISGEGYAALPSWSPDGSRLAFVRAEPGAPSVWNIWIQPLAGGPPQRVTRYRDGQTWTASWFPDGDHIAYSHQEELTILDLATSQAWHFASPVPGRLVRTPAVSPDGSRVVFQVFRSGVWMLNVHDASMERVLADPTAEEFAWAPDGQRFAFHSRRDGQWSIYVLAASATAP